MNRISADTTSAATFVIRFWREWSRWRGRIEHVQSGQRADFLGVKTLMAFLDRFGIRPEADPASRAAVSGEAGTGDAGNETSFVAERRMNSAGVYSLHMLALKAGASRPEFERFFREEIESAQAPSGLTLRLLRGDRGDREGKYLLMAEFESVERRYQLYGEAGPGARKVSDEVMLWMGAAAPILARWNEYTTPFDTIFTDYKEV